MCYNYTLENLIAKVSGWTPAFLSEYSDICTKKIDLTNYIAKPATENFKGEQVIVKDFSLNVPSTLIKEKIGNVPFNLEVQYQGCSKLGLCYAPTSKTFKFPKIDNIK